MRNAFDWFSGLTLAHKALAVLVAGLVVFSVVYCLATVFLYLSDGGEASSPVEEGARPAGSASASASASAGPSASASGESTTPDIGVSITGARWEGERAVVEGTWKGDVSSVHCDLLRSDTRDDATDWWDRSVGPRMEWTAQAFTQEFVEDRGREAEDPIDPRASYEVACQAQFSGGWATGDDAPVEGTPAVSVGG